MINTDPKLCLAPGTTLGKNYQIIKMIGKGGMGSVYLAFDTRLDLQVAIKVISPEFSQTMEASELDGVLKRFESEAKSQPKSITPMSSGYLVSAGKALRSTTIVMISIIW